MWTGNRFVQLLPAILLALLASSCASHVALENVEGIAQPGMAWWYDFEQVPQGREVRGIPIGEFEVGWTAATVLRDEVLAHRVSRAGLALYLDSGLSFVAEQDLDLDGVDEKMFVGTFEDSDGTRGRFLAVSREGRLVRHFEHAGSAGFSALLPVEDGVRWYKCLECGEYELLRWTGESYVLD